MRDFKELLVWQKAIKLVTDVYALTKDFPSEEKYGLTSQIRRSAVSIPSNISEGHMRSTNKDFAQFLSIARGSCAELETQCIIAYNLKYMQEEYFTKLITQIYEISKMLSSLRSKL